MVSTDMWSWQKSFIKLWSGFSLLTLLNSACSAENLPLPDGQAKHEQIFAVRGVVKEIRPADQKIIITHEAISNYMDAMTMPFKVKSIKELVDISKDDQVSFKLHVTDVESWVDGIKKTGISTPPEAAKIHPTSPVSSNSAPARAANPLLDYKFTNELGQAVSIHDFRGKALAITFFFTRCPLPEYCPRLSKNFEEASDKLKAMPEAPTNWHLISITFDPKSDTPEVLKAYGERYHYDPAHWSFLTGPMDKIEEMAHGSGVTYEPEGGFLNHNFRTLIIDANGRLQMVFPTSGDLSDQIVSELLKAAKPASDSTSK